MDIEVSFFCELPATLFQHAINPELKGFSHKRVYQVSDVLPVEHINLSFNDRKCLVHFWVLLGPYEQVSRREMFKLRYENVFYIRALDQLPFSGHDVS